jgi:Spy/CpxP family protein refolding chaperone
MRILGVVLAAVVLILPGLAAGQAVPLLPDPSGATGPPPDLLAQGPGGFPPPMPGELRPGGRGGPAPPGPPPPARMMGPGPGAWWKDSEIVRKLGLSEAQVGRIEQTFLEYRLRLVDLRADLEKQELSLQPLLDADRPDEAKVAAQIDLITTARGKLEKENALMLLAIRRVLSTDQWKQLQGLQQERARGIHVGPPVGPPAGSERRR